jgi:hypothetical protein
MDRQILFKISNAKFYLSPCSATRPVPCALHRYKRVALGNSSVNLPKNGCRGNSLNVKTMNWFSINDNDNKIHYNKKCNRQVD